MNIKLKNLSPTEAIIQIEGEIGLDESWQFADDEQSSWGEKIATYERFSTRLNALVESGIENVKVEIRSAGGSVQDALLIHSALVSIASQGVEVATHCYGFTASAATIIAQAASAGKRYIAASAMYLIHNASAAIEGNAADAAGIADLLAKIDGQIAAIYATRSGREGSRFGAIMARGGGKGEWLTPIQVVDEGLADAIEKVSPIKNIASQVRMFLQRLFDENGGIANDSKLAPQSVPLLLDGVEPTKTLNKEDPQIDSDAMTLTQNQSAYGQDATLFGD